MGRPPQLFDAKVKNYVELLLSENAEADNDVELLMSENADVDCNADIFIAEAQRRRRWISDTSLLPV